MAKKTYNKLMPDLTIVIPARREAKRIGKSLDELATYLKTDNLLKNLTIEILVVAADAGDDTAGVTMSRARKFKNIRVLKPGTIVGKGRDVAYGMLRAKGKIIVFMDADLATPLWHISEFYADFIDKKPDVLVGVRNLYKHHPSKIRRVVSNVGNLFFKIAGGVWIADSQCGFKMFSKKSSKICFSKLTILGWGFDMEVLAIAKTNGLTIKSKRIDDWISVPGGVFEDSIVSSSIKSLGELSKIFLRRISGKYRDH